MNLDNFMLLFNRNTMPDCFIFSETWYDGFEPILLPDFTGFHTVRKSRRSGGVSIYVKNSFNSEFIDELSYANESIEICTVKVSTEHSKMFICGVYRPHEGTIENFTFSLETILENRIFSGADCLVGGDLNIDISCNGGSIDGFIDMMQSHHFLQTISEFTRPTINEPNRGSLLDHLWLNNISNYNSGIIKTGITDHYTTFILLPFQCKTNQKEKIKISFRDCSPQNQANFEAKVNDFNWNNLRCNDPDIYMQNIISSLNRLYHS